MLNKGYAVLLFYDGNEGLLSRYEALEVVKNNRKEIERVWDNNKTPCISVGEAREETIPFKGSVFRLPEHLDKEIVETFCHMRGIECGEYITGEKHDTRKDSCFLCKIGKDKREFFSGSHSEMSDIIMYESEHFYVKIELGCLVEGMCMICPKEHILSAASMPAEWLKEYEECQEDIAYLCSNIFGGPVIFFEHGSDPSGFSTHMRSIVHAHVHVAPGIQFPERYLSRVQLKRVNNLFDLSGCKYMSYQIFGEELYAVTDPDVYVQRQYPRQVIAELVGIPNELANWRKEAFWDRIKSTYTKWYEWLTTNSNTLEERIKERTLVFLNEYNV